MDFSAIRQSISKVNSCLETIKKNLDDLYVHINEKRFVSSDEITASIEKLLALSDAQKECSKEYSVIFPDEECPNLLDEISTAVDAYEAGLENAKLKNEARQIISKFSCIRSDIADCQAWLDTYTEQLKGISTEGFSLDEYKSAIFPYEEFFETVKSSSNDQKIAYVQKNTIFKNSTEIYRVLTKEIYVDENMLADVFNNESCNSIPNAVAVSSDGNEDADDIETDEGKSENVNETVQSEEELVSDNTLTASDEATSVSDEIMVSEDKLSDEEQKIIDSIVSAGIITAVRTGYGDPVIINNATDKKITLKMFKKDMENFKSGNGFTLMGLDKFPIVSASFLKASHKIYGRALDFEPMLESLTQSGYLQKRTLGNMPSSYDLTTQSIACLKVAGYRDWFKKLAPNMQKWRTGFEKRKDVSSQENLTNNLLNENAFLKVSELIYSMPNKSFLKSKTTIHEFFHVGLYKMLAHSILSIGTFLAEPVNALKYYMEINEYLSEIKEPVPVVIASAETEEDCKKSIAFWKAGYDCLTNAKIVYYPINKNVFCFDTENYIDMIECANAIYDYLCNLGDDVSNEGTVAETEIANKPKDDVLLNDSEEITATEDSTVNTDDGITASESESINKHEQPAEHHKSTVQILNIPESEVLSNVFEMINSDKAYCACAYLSALSNDKKYDYLKNQLAYALNAPDKKGFYHSNVIMSFFDDESFDFGAFSEYLKTAADLRSLFYHTSNNDYGYKQMYEGMKYLSCVLDDTALSSLIFALKEFKDRTAMGIDAVADYRIKDNIERDKQTMLFSKDASDLYGQYVLNPLKERCALPRYMDMKKMIFKKDSTLSECLKIAADNSSDKDYIEYVGEFLHAYFIDKDMDVRSQNIRRHSIGKFIDSYWAEAGKNQRDKHKSSKLVSELRNNITGCLQKIISTLCDWYYYAHHSDETGNTEGYAKDKNQVKTAVSNAINSIRNRIAVEKDAEIKAGNKCILQTLEEFAARLDGTYEDNGNKFFYIDFLMYSDVLLTNNYLPDISGFNTTVFGFMPYERIMNHSKKTGRSFDERIDEIFNRNDDFESDTGDDYGSALMIKKYYLSTDKYWDDERNDIDENASCASKQFKYRYEEMIGTLELAQSYGQIDTDRKEQLLAIVSSQFKNVSENRNYGYFGRLLDAVKRDIKLGAKIREASLRENLNSMSNEYFGNDEARLYIAEAEKMMNQQNYTVAEDLIHRIQSGDFSQTDSVMTDDILDNFLSEYEMVYRIVSDSSVNLSRAIQRNSHGAYKDIKRGQILIDNFPVGNNTNIDRIRTFISYLRFNVKSVTANTPISTTHNSFSIELNKNPNGKRENFTHPIAAFGSLALENGFRVLCLFGTYDTRRLLDKFRELGTSKHTIVLLDYALKLTERRTLARKIKEEFADKVFIVVDRVAVYYLADHYAENTINRALMEITMPYSYYQPYYVDSSRAIPVEMFMGRKEQLEDIESPNGANIICGGRQLGKSALLRMAKSDINDNENGDRAVYVEIKGCDSKRAAQKISKTLVDEGILDEGGECDNWDDLSRNIKKRLKSETQKRIPYLLLLIDEADAFIESCKAERYEPFDYLEDIQNVGVNRFKFVVAGLRNLVKFERELATSNNSGLAHLSSKTIRPFTTAEAQELLEKPLHYLGIRFPKDKSYLVSLILANTNYFPGLIHFYCAKLIDAMRKDYAGYDENSTPPYEVNEAHIKKVLADPEFNNQIKDKFEITLKLDTDNYYHIIAVLMAYCMYSNNSGDGYSADDIYQTAEQYCIGKIQKLTVEKLTVLMDELCELNILRKGVGKKYHFARYNFIQLLGSSEDIDNAMLTYSEE